MKFKGILVCGLAVSLHIDCSSRSKEPVLPIETAERCQARTYDAQMRLYNEQNRLLFGSERALRAKAKDTATGEPLPTPRAQKGSPIAEQKFGRARIPSSAAVASRASVVDDADIYTAAPKIGNRPQVVRRRSANPVVRDIAARSQSHEGMTETLGLTKRAEKSGAPVYVAPATIEGRGTYLSHYPVPLRGGARRFAYSHGHSRGEVKAALAGWQEA